MKCYQSRCCFASIVASLGTPALAQLPYSPTVVLRPQQPELPTYIFKDSQLLALNVSTRLTTTGPTFATIYDSLPFLASNSNNPFTPVIDGDGNITVFTGSCSAGSAGSQLWKFVPDSKSQGTKGTWVQETTTAADATSRLSSVGASYLSTGIAFSSIVGSHNSSADYYVFGGMCPLANATQSTWQSAANYSNTMVTLEPPANQKTSFELGTVSSRGPPIPEAGFTITALESTYSNNTDGTQNQQQTFVLIGGHTATAFINMSQVALFTLPQEGWTFLGVNQPNSDNTELTKKDAVTEVEPRSGHTAVLTSDGKTIVVFGGWIGDINTPATPQLAVMQVGEGYGGSGAWSWTVPSASGSGIAAGSGLYGHGATMLPGNIMMVVGGNQIAAPSNRFFRRAAAGPSILLYNVTSNAWISEYSPPTRLGAVTEAQDNGPLASAQEKAGLGVGVAIGFAAVIGLVVFYLWYTRRLRKQREAREKELTEMGYATQAFDHSLGHGLDGRDAGDHLLSYQIGHQGWRSTSGHDVERTGLLIEIPSPTRGLRKGQHTRGGYQLAPRNDEKRLSGASGLIHPIDEQEEEEEHRMSGATVATPMAERRHKKTMSGISAVSNAPTLDPFCDPDPLGSHPVSPDMDTVNMHSRSLPTSPVENRHVGLQSWSNDWERSGGKYVNGQYIHPAAAGGRVSPTKSERTESSLSEKSARSYMSSRSGHSAGRLNSITNTYTTPEPSPQSESPSEKTFYGQTASSSAPGGNRTRSFTSSHAIRPTTSASHNGDADSFTTAKSSFAQLQAEGEALLGGRPTETDMTTAILASSSEERSLTRPRTASKSWIGSVRRAIGSAAGARTRSMTSRTPRRPRFADDEATLSQTGPGTMRRTATMPDASVSPRRAASDASFWRSKRGERDWLMDEDPLGNDWRRKSGDDWGSPEDQQHRQVEAAVRGRDDDEEWDVEAAAERRTVQVMFTVPRQRLRVVNQSDADGRSLRSARSSIRSVRSNDSDRKVSDRKISGSSRDGGAARAGPAQERIEE